MNNPTHMRHRCRASRAEGRKRPDDIRRASPIIASVIAAPKTNVEYTIAGSIVPTGLARPRRPSRNQVSGDGACQDRRGCSQPPVPGRRRPDGRESRDHEVSRHQSTERIRIRQAVAGRKERPAESHREHRADKQNAGSPVQRRPLRREQRNRAKNHRQSAGDDV